MEDQVSQVAEEIVTLLATYGLDVVGAIVILIIGIWVAGWTRRWLGRALARTGRVDQTLQSFLSSLARYLILAITVLAVLSQFGVQTASLIAVLGTIGLAIGLALQGTLSNVAAGVMLLVFRPFRVGDYVEAGGVAGSVKALNLFTTELATPDNVQILVPNGQIWGAAVKNYSFHETRRVDLMIGIDYGDDMDKAIEAVRAVIGADDRVLAEPDALVVIGELADSSVNLVVRVWCLAENYWPLKFDLTKALKERFDREGLSIPFPQSTVHMVPATP
ncbi:MAG: mechanosensitive ion channel [Alphaproteobacteria bacterium]|nr:mechanosensitive ion channel [Alphaproteobacteria bacterium]